MVYCTAKTSNVMACVTVTVSTTYPYCLLIGGRTFWKLLKFVHLQLPTSYSFVLYRFLLDALSPQDDFSESSEVSTYLEGLSSAETSQSNLTETAPTVSLPPELLVTDLTGLSEVSSPHQRLAATRSAPPSFPPAPHFPAPPPARPAPDSQNTGGSPAGPKVDKLLKWVFRGFGFSVRYHIQRFYKQRKFLTLNVVKTTGGFQGFMFYFPNKAVICLLTEEKERSPEVHLIWAKLA